MKSRTSFFNWTALKKDITRFAPIWGLYTIFQLLFVLLMWEGEGSAARFMNNASGIMHFMGLLNFAYAGLCVLALFGDLFNPKMCNALHAMPLRREGWFFTHCIAGLSFSVVPNTLGAMLASVILQEYCYGAFLWLSVTTLQFLFFFGISAFCAVCAGNRLGTVAMYILSNFLAVLAAWLTMTFYEPVLYGIQLDFDKFSRFSPVVSFTNSGYIDTHYDNMRSTTVFDGFIPEDWRYLFVAAAVGVVLLTLALLVYRNRKLETAGDFISAKPAGPVFLILYTLCAGAVMYFISEITTESLQYMFLVIGFGIGFFTGKMLLERRVRVFRGKNWLALGGLVLAFFFSITLTVLDPIGITRYVPDIDHVEKVQISPYSYNQYLNRTCVFTNKQDIEAVIGVHRYALENRHPQGDTAYVYIEYTMKNGTTLSRQYELDQEADAYQSLKPYYSSTAFVLGTDNISHILDNMIFLEFYPSDPEVPYMFIGSPDWTDVNNTDKYGSLKDPVKILQTGDFSDNAIAAGLLKAIELDCAEGNMAPNWYYHDGHDNVGSFHIQYHDSYGIRYTDFELFRDAAHTVAYIKSLEAQ